MEVAFCPKFQDLGLEALGTGTSMFVQVDAKFVIVMSHCQLFCSLAGWATHGRIEKLG